MSSSEKSYLDLHVTHPSLNRDIMYLSSKFARFNSLDKRRCDIDLMNEHGQFWTLRLRYNKASGQTFIRGAWRSFCRDNGIKAGSFCRFKLVQIGNKPVIQLCLKRNTSKANIKRNVSEIESDEDFAETVVPMHQNKIVTLVFKPNMLLQFRLPASFTRENRMKEGEVSVVNKDGVEWKLYLVNIKGRNQFYIRGCKEFFMDNNIKNNGESFTVEAIQGGRSPILKICSKVKEETENRVQKKARVYEEGGPSRHTRTSNKGTRHTRASNKARGDTGNLERKQELESRSMCEHVKELKEVIVNTSTDMRRIRSEVEEKEQDLQISLDEIEALEEKIMGISKVFNVNQV